jgi:hypothetical protein
LENRDSGLTSGCWKKLSRFVCFNCQAQPDFTQFAEWPYRFLTAHQQNGVEMKFNVRQAAWVFAISAGLLATSGFVQAQDDHGRGQDNRHGDQGNIAPTGGYAQTCQDIRTNGTTLEARCRTRDGNWNPTSLQNFNQCAGGIENDDGRLVCNNGTNGAQGYRLGDQQGDRRDNVQNDRQGNQQGYRRDNNQYDRRARNGAPEGGYMQSCQDIRTVGTTLQASCQKRNGKWKQASLRNFNQCTNQIENNNGKLVCNR